MALDAAGQVYVFGTGESNEFAGTAIPPRCAAGTGPHARVACGAALHGRTAAAPPPPSPPVNPARQQSWMHPHPPPPVLLVVPARGVDSDLILRLWAQRIAPELTRDEEGNELPVPRYCRPQTVVWHEQSPQISVHRSTAGLTPAFAREIPASVAVFEMGSRRVPVWVPVHVQCVCACARVCALAPRFWAPWAAGSEA